MATVPHTRGLHQWPAAPLPATEEAPEPAFSVSAAGRGS